MMKKKLTKKAVDAIPFATGKQQFYSDTHLQGFGLRVGKTAKTYFVEKRVGGRTVRSSIGRHGQVTAEFARKEAQKRLGEMTTGLNPNETKRQHQNRDLTPLDAFEIHKETRPNLRAGTVREYGRLLATVLAPVADQPISKIDGTRIVSLHRQITDENGEAIANSSMRALRSVINVAHARIEADGHTVPWDRNPVEILSRTKSWNVVSKRSSYIPLDSLPSWFEAVSELAEHGEAGVTVRDYLLLILMTGLRREEAARIRWQDVSFAQRTITIPTTKNHDPLVLPMSDFVLQLLQQRQAYQQIGFVFPGKGCTRHIVEPRRQIERVRQACGINFTIHDLRRTFATTAESIDIPYFAVKRLLNHRDSGDVTAGYIQVTVERLRSPMNKINDYLLDQAGAATRSALVGGHPCPHASAGVE